MLPDVQARRRCRDARGHHPWRFAGLLTGWRIDWTEDLPPGRFGLTIHSERRILMAEGQTEAERRCTIAHEASHVLRGPTSTHGVMREETLVDRQVARLLLPSVQRIGHALAWHRADHDAAAHDLWVDPETLDVRRSTLAPAERRWLNEQLDLIMLDR